MGLPVIDHRFSKLSDRYGKKASSATDAKNVGNGAARVLYHFYCAKSRYSPILGRHEKGRSPTLNQKTDVFGFKKRVVLTCGSDVAFDRGPDVFHERRGNTVDGHVT